MRTTRSRVMDMDELQALRTDQTKVLDPAEERRLLKELAATKQKLNEYLARIPQAGLNSKEGGPTDLAECARAACAGASPKVGAKLGAIAHQYSTLRERLAMANIRLVAYVARQFRDRGIATVDLIQDGFCGLLEAIDRFDLTHETKLATYATWWIRQAMQRAVAAGAYPVRLSPRHLRQLAQNQDELHGGGDGASRQGTGTVHHIHLATRPTISLDASLREESQFSLLQTMSDPDGDRTGEIDVDETLQLLLKVLRPRERDVLALRFGLGGGEKMSLSQVGKALSVSKERVRQIQDRALEKLRGAAVDLKLQDCEI